MGKTIIDLANSEAAITDPSQYYIETQKIGDSSTKRTLLTKLITYLQTVFAPKFVATNTASGTTSVTINATSGVATFTADVVQGVEYTAFTINNNLVTNDTLLRLDLSYVPNDTETCQISSYGCSSGVINIFMTNFSGVDATLQKSISFQILN